LVINNLAPLAGLLHPPPGYVPLFMPRNQDNAQHLTWIEAYKSSWTIPDYHAPWSTEAGLRVPLMWIPARVSTLTRMPSLYSYLGLQIACYVLALYALAFLLRVSTDSARQAAWAFALMICAVPVRSFALVPALLLKSSAWAVLHCGYSNFLGGYASDGLFQGVTCGATITLGTAGVLLFSAFFVRYINTMRRSNLWAASLTLGLSGFFHPFEFIPMTAAAALTLLWKERSLRRAIKDLAIIGLPALAVMLFYVLPVLRHPWLRVAADLNHWQSFRISHQEVLALSLPIFLGAALAFWPPRAASGTDYFLACYVLTILVMLPATFLPWPQHFKDGLDYLAAILVARKLDQSSAMMRIFANRRSWRVALVVLLVAGALFTHVYFRYLTYRSGAISTESGQNTALAPRDEVRAIEWLRGHASSGQLILAPREYSPWMATVPMHSLASHWIFSLTMDQQVHLVDSFFEGGLTDSACDAFLKRYGVRYVLAPAGSPALRYLHDAELRWTGESLRLYEFPQNEMGPFPNLEKSSPGRYIWNSN
jgi:hypothetical protein